MVQKVADNGSESHVTTVDIDSKGVNSCTFVKTVLMLLVVVYHCILY